MNKETYLSDIGTEKHILYDDIAPGFHLSYRNEAADSHMPPHIHNAAEFYLNLTDLPNVLLGDRLYAVPAGSLILFPSSCIHRTVRALGERYERYVLFIHIEWFEKVMVQNAAAFHYLSDTAHPVIVPLDTMQLSLLKQQFHNLLVYNNMLTPESLSVFFSIMQTVDTLLKQVLQAADELRKGPLQAADAAFDGTFPFVTKPSVRKTVPPVPQQRVNDIIAYLHEHFCEDISMEDLAETFYLDADYIARIFKKYTNTTVRRYIALQRITKAGALLKEGHSATETCRMVGYQDYSLFYRNFHHIMGVAPMEFVSAGKV